MTDQRKLGIYLNDHLAGAGGVIELAKRCRSNNARTPLGMYLATLVEELESARRSLEQVMDAVGARRDPVKLALVWAAERIGRLKPNGQLVGYSALSRLEEVEAICMGVDAQGSLWRSLRVVAELDGRLQDVDFAALQERARGQRETLERHRIEAAMTAFAP